MTKVEGRPLDADNYCFNLSGLGMFEEDLAIENI